jgi:esterase/lipase superfamily enzyme
MGMRLLLRCLIIAALALPLPAAALDLLLDSRVAAALAENRPDDAVAATRAALSDASEPAEVLAVLERLADLLTRLDRHAEAAPVYEQIARLQERQLGRTAPEAAGAWQAAGTAWEAAGDEPRALAAWSEALRIDVAGGLAPAASPAQQAADRLIASAPETQRAQLSRQLRDPLSVTTAAGPRTSRSAAPAGTDTLASATTDAGYSLVRIYYATNRLRTAAVRPTDIYAADRGPLDYGTATVSVPKIHRPGALEAPSIFSFDVAEDPERHLILRTVEPSDQSTVFGQMRDQLAASSSDEAFVFVHGFNVTFADAARRTAQIAYDMNFDGLPILYSWPSQGNIMGYLADGAVVQLSGRLLSEFLEQVVADSGARRIHLVAHSMGNRALTEALELFALRHAGEPPAFDQVLFTAPDLDAGLFANMVGTIRPAVNRMTLYTSKNDWALRVSNSLNGGAPRAGEGADGVVLPASVDSIDMSVLGEDMLAHSYFADDTSALTDILSLFWRDAPPDRRCGMTVSAAGVTSATWSLEPTLCDGGAMLAALRLLRAERIGNLSAAISVIEAEFPTATPEQRAAIEAALRRLFQ